MSLLHEMLRKKSNGPIILDGSKGVYSFPVMDEITHADDLAHLKPYWVKTVARRYIQAGSDIIQSFTFGLNARNRKDLTPDELYSRNKEAVRHAIDARRGNNVLVAASIGPLLGEFIMPPNSAKPKSSLHILYEDALPMYRTQIAGCIAGGADLLSIETINDPISITASLNAAKQAMDDERRKVPIAITMNFASHSPTHGWRTLHKVGVSDLVARADEEENIVAVGANCGFGFENADKLTCEFSNSHPKRALIWMKLNAGNKPRIGNQGETIYELATIEHAKRYARAVFTEGASAIGGCCGTTPELIHAMKEELA